MENKLVTIKQLDYQLLAIKESGGGAMPKQGWVRTTRKALGMTIKQLAKRLGVDPSRVVKIETAETDGAVTLHTLRAVAEQFDCFLEYHFIPKKSLETMVKNRAKKKVDEQVKRTAHTMSLEAQGVSKDWLEMQSKELMRETLSQNWKYLWEEK
ncbi:MAG: mobile mystery protein A [Gammaproteobacteria bacterium]|nr:mobile mystery protein A [Gammaproteobacteria bacterium]